MDLDADIRAGDLFSFGVKDHREAFGHYGNTAGVVKRIIGINPEMGFLECDCTKPPYIIHTGLSTLRWAHRVRATAPTMRQAKRLLSAVKHNPAAFDALLIR